MGDEFERDYLEDEFERDYLEDFMEIFPYPWTEETYNEIYGEED